MLDKQVERGDTIPHVLGYKEVKEEIPLGDPPIYSPINQVIYLSNYLKEYASDQSRILVADPSQMNRRIFN